VEDPRTRSSFATFGAYIAGVRADYRRALELIQMAEREIDAFNLDFARPHAKWNTALILLGLRKFGAADRSLQSVEDITKSRPLGYHVLNARILRARLAIETGQDDLALQTVTLPVNDVAIPSIHGEYVATRGLVLSVLGKGSEALEAAGIAERTTGAIEVRVLAQAVRAVCGAREGDPTPAQELWRVATELGAWDPVVAAVRSFRPLADMLAEIEEIRPGLAALYERSNDLALARRAGLRTRSSRQPNELLSPRELEVVELMARGFRNRDISNALVISESTTKAHVRHAFEKLGVRTRAEAVARFNASN
jgi:DNA-binding NarL/FixJ family response regulator